MGYDRDEIVNVIEKANKQVAAGNSSSQQSKSSNEILDAYLLMKENHALVKDLKRVNQKTLNHSYPNLHHQVHSLTQDQQARLLVCSNL